MRFFIALILLSSLPACNFRLWKPRPSSETRLVLVSELPDSLSVPVPDLPNLHCPLRVIRMGCGGPCPEWEARFFSSGTAIWIGNDLENRHGAFSATYSQEALDQLLTQALNEGFFELPASIPPHPAALTQLPHWDIAISLDSMQHRVAHFQQGPASLRQFERQLEGLIRSLDWERIDQ